MVFPHPHHQSLHEPNGCIPLVRTSEVNPFRLPARSPSGASISSFGRRQLGRTGLRIRWAKPHSLVSAAALSIVGGGLVPALPAARGRGKPRPYKTAYHNACTLIVFVFSNPRHGRQLRTILCPSRAVLVFIGSGSPRASRCPPPPSLCQDQAGAGSQNAELARRCRIGSTGSRGSERRPPPGYGGGRSPRLRARPIRRPRRGRQPARLHHRRPALRRRDPLLAASPGPTALSAVDHLHSISKRAAAFGSAAAGDRIPAAAAHRRARPKDTPNCPDGSAVRGSRPADREARPAMAAGRIARAMVSVGAERARRRGGPRPNTRRPAPSVLVGHVALSGRPGPQAARQISWDFAAATASQIGQSNQENDIPRRHGTLDGAGSTSPIRSPRQAASEGNRPRLIDKLRPPHTPS